MRAILNTRKSAQVSFTDGVKVIDPMTARIVLMFYDAIKDPRKKAIADKTIVSKMGFKLLSTKASEAVSGAGPGGPVGDSDDPLSKAEKKVKRKLNKNSEPTMEDNLTVPQKKAGQLDATQKAKKISPMLGNNKQKMHPFNGKLVGASE